MLGAGETAEERIANLASQDNPLNKFARTTATQNMSRRGIRGSSIHTGEAVKQMILASAPAAMQDAGAFQQQRLTMLGGDIQSKLGREGAGYAKDLQQQAEEAALLRSREGITSAEKMQQIGIEGQRGTLGEEIASRERMQGVGVEADAARQAASIQAQTDLTNLQAGLAEAQATNDFTRAQELQSQIDIVKERMQTAGLESAERMQATGIRATADLQADAQNFAKWSQEEQQVYGLALQNDAQNFDKWSQKDQQIFMSTAREDVQNFDDWQADKQRAYGKMLQDDMQAFNSWSQDDQQAHVRFMQREIQNFDKWSQTEKQNFAKWMQTDSQNINVEMQKRDIQGRKDLQQAAITGDSRQLSRQLTANRDQWQADLLSRMDLANIEVTANEKQSMANSATALSDTYLREINNIQRDPNVKDKAAAIQSATNAYHAQLATVGSIFEAEINIDFGGFAAPGEGGEITTPYIEPEGMTEEERARQAAIDAIKKVSF
jgi:hypothetical protein